MNNHKINGLSIKVTEIFFAFSLINNQRIKNLKISKVELLVFSSQKTFVENWPMKSEYC